MKKRNFHAGNFPVVLKIIDGFLLMSSSDFGLTVKKRFDSFRKAEEIGNLYLDLVRKIDEEMKGMERRKESVPEPKRLKDAIPKEAPQTFSVPEVARALGVSQDTIRRMADQGKLRCRLTQGGHRRFSVHEVERAREALDQADSTDAEIF